MWGLVILWVHILYNSFDARNIGAVLDVGFLVMPYVVMSNILPSNWSNPTRPSRNRSENWIRVKRKTRIEPNKVGSGRISYFEPNKCVLSWTEQNKTEIVMQNRKLNRVRSVRFGSTRFWSVQQFGLVTILRISLLISIWLIVLYNFNKSNIMYPHSKSLCLNYEHHHANNISVNCT